MMLLKQKIAKNNMNCRQIIRVPNNIASRIVYKNSFEDNIIGNISVAETFTPIISKGMVLFTLFYTSMNWLYYKRIREDAEKENHKNK